MNFKLKVLVSLLCVTAFCVLLRGNVSVFSQLQDTSCCACDKCLTEDDPWLMQRLYKSVEPFLSSSYSLSEDAFNWWKASCHEKSSLTCSYQISIREWEATFIIDVVTIYFSVCQFAQVQLIIGLTIVCVWYVCQNLQSEKGSYSTYSTTVNRLFQMFPPSPDLIESSPERCRACAVVGNSGNFRVSHYGSLIDFHDVVIR